MSNTRCEDTLIIYDWDDTLYPNTYLTKGYVDNIQCPAVQNNLRTLELINVQLLQRSLNLGTVIIVTNSSQRRMERTCQDTMPKVWELIQRKNIRYISARDILSPYTADPYEWKAEVFDNEVLSLMQKSSKPQLVSIGDGTTEQDICRSMIGVLPRSSVKVVKLQREHNVEKFMEQKRKLVEKIESIVTCGEHVDMKMT